MKIGLIYTGVIRQEQHDFALRLAEQTSRELLSVNHIPSDIEDFCEQQEIDLLFICCRNKRQDVQLWLNRCRELRLPYIFITDTMQHLRQISTVLTPISMLEEEVHKTEILTHLARFTGAEIILLQANDYGTRAEQNTNKILTALHKFNLPAKTEKAKKDSFSVVKEAAERQKDWLSDILVVTASREYGLDDLLFGPAERKAILRSNIPVLLLNPRSDLFSLCD